jgi:hypothetical protein
MVDRSKSGIFFNAGLLFFMSIAISPERHGASRRFWMFVVSSPLSVGKSDAIPTNNGQLTTDKFTGG